MLAPSRSSVVATGLTTVTVLVIAGLALAARGQETPPTFVAAGKALQSARTVPDDRALQSPAIPAAPVQGPVGDGWLFGGPGFAGRPVEGPPGASGVLLGGDGVLLNDSGVDLAANGIPTTALTAYRQAATREAGLRPLCKLRWPLLAAIGRVESNHGRYAGAVLHVDGLSTPRILGIPLNGVGTEVVRDTDGGRLDGDRVYDRAVGPMQFIPSTWAGFGVDANGDGKRDPNNIFDAAAAAADYLCAAGRDLSTYAGQVRAVRSYNNSDAYIAMVLGLERSYAHGVTTVPTAPGHGSTGPIGRAPRLPPVDPGRPRGVEPKPQPAAGTPSGGSPSPTTPAPTTPTSPTPTSPAPTSPVPTSPSPTTPAPDPDPSSTSQPTPTDPSDIPTEPSPTCRLDDAQSGTASPAQPVDGQTQTEAVVSSVTESPSVPGDEGADPDPCDSIAPTSTPVAPTPISSVQR